MRIILLSAALCTVPGLHAQPYAIGSTSTSYFDPVRTRDVGCDIHYPALTDGTDTPVAAGAFPVLVIGHGFVMSVTAYEYLWQHFTPLGFIVVLPTTEGGILPDHEAFGADLAFLAGALQAANTDPLSPFLGHVSAATALMGHSMGGGAATLGAANNTTIQALITLAPAETTPSAIAAASSVQVPTLVIAASEDCVTPIADHAQPIFDALTMPCRALVNITGGGHCYFGDPNFNCTFGEFTCGPNLTITRPEQQDVVLDIAGLWLDHFLLGDAGAYVALLDSLGASTRFSASTTCLSTGHFDAGPVGPTVGWDADVRHVLVTNGPPGGNVRVHDATGRELASAIIDAASTAVEVPVEVTSMVLVTVFDGTSGMRWSFPCLVRP